MANGNVLFDLYDSIVYVKAYYWRELTESHLGLTENDGQTLLEHLRAPKPRDTLIYDRGINTVKTQQLARRYKCGNQGLKQRAKYLNTVRTCRNINRVTENWPFYIRKALKRI